MKSVDKLSPVLIFSIFLLLSIPSFSQTITPTPPNQDDKDVVKISTTLIQVDATVTDRKGNIVRDLKPEDFEIYENGKKQTINNFSFVDTTSENQSGQSNQKTKSTDKPLIPLPPVKLKPEQVRRTYAMVVDDLGLSFADTDYVKDTLKKFVNEQMQEGDLVAIIRVGSGLGALQSFTSDKRVLLAAINKIRWNVNGRVGVNSYEPFERELPNSMSDNGNPGQLAARQEKNDRDNKFVLGAESSHQSNIVVGTLGALNYIIKGMSSLPGRKSVMLFSEGFQTLDYSKGKPEQNRIVDEMKLLTDFANRSSVVFYTFDPSGIDVPMIEARDDVGANGTRSVGNFTGFDIRQMQIRNTKDSLRYLAEQTGGLAYVDLNRMDYGVQKALNDQNGYYLIGYQPDEETFDANKAKFNKLEVKIKRPDLKIRYRSGFFGITDENLRKAQTASQQLSTALASPFGATGINIDLYSFFINDAQNRNFIHSFLRIDANDLKFTQLPDGRYKALVEIYAMTFGDNGVPVNRTIKGYAIHLDAKTYQQVLQKGLIYDFPLAIKNPGAYQFRIALIDTDSNKIGSASQFIEVPNISKKNFALSNIILKNYSVADWKKVNGEVSADTEQDNVYSDFISRRFKRGTVMNYSYIIYNAKTGSGQSPQLKIQARLFFNGKLLSEGPPRPIDIIGQKDLQRIELSNAVTLGTNLQPGDYALQLIVTDNLATQKKQTATQSIDFEIVE